MHKELARLLRIPSKGREGLGYFLKYTGCRKGNFITETSRPELTQHERGRTRSKVKGQMSKSGQNKKRGREISMKERPSGSRPLKVVVDSKGNPWICDCQVDPSKDLAEQGCWQLTDEGSTLSKERKTRQKRRKIS